MNRIIVWAFALPGFLVATAWATPTVTVGDYIAIPGESVPIQIRVSGGDAVQGLNLRLAIGDETSPNQPIISAVDIVGPGTIFNGNNTGQVHNLFPPPGLVTNTTTTTAFDTVIADGVLANIVIDLPLNIAPGFYPIKLHFDNTSPALVTDFAGVSAIFVEGSITTLLPEPGSIVLALFALAGLCALAVRRRVGS